MYVGAACHPLTGRTDRLHIFQTFVLLIGHTCSFRAACHPVRRVTGIADKLKKKIMLLGTIDAVVCWSTFCSYKNGWQSGSNIQKRHSSVKNAQRVDQRSV